jgi:hypothetical protein
VHGVLSYSEAIKLDDDTLLEACAAIDYLGELQNKSIKK